MRKIELAKRIAEETGLTALKAEAVVDAILDEIKTSLSEGESVILRESMEMLGVRPQSVSLQP
jgi:nucleoid DNA-binding protein